LFSADIPISRNLRGQQKIRLNYGWMCTTCI